MKKSIVLAIAVTVVNLNLMSQQTFYNVDSGKKFSARNFTGVPYSVSFLSNSTVTKGDFMEQMKKEFKFDEANKLEFNRSRNKGSSKEHMYNQKYKSVRVEEGRYSLYEENGKITSARGYFYANLSINVTPNITKKTAIEKALNYFKLAQYRWENSAHETALKRKTGNSKSTYYPKPKLIIAAADPDRMKGEELDFKLCWKFFISGVSDIGGPVKEWIIYIDAHSGRVVKKVDVRI